MTSLRCTLAVFLAAGALACSDDHEEHEFETYVECYQHYDEEGLTDVGATTECDAFFEVEHEDNADCVADHGVDVTAGVPDAAIVAHCDAAFPPA
ncbi:MAG TPA: hypothetical protein VFU21_29280 [Kofleriaceae bacterium]|nr:hypothetical protein [Kofleriaceae bacterium]